MRIIYIPAAVREFEEKLERIAKNPFTTHSVQDFLDDMSQLETEIMQHPGQRPVLGADPGWFRVGPSRVYSYSLIYRLKNGNAYVVAAAAPTRRPFYWLRRKD
jgi:hypothetical protein